MTSNTDDIFHITITAPRPPSALITWMGLVMQNILSQIETEKEQEIEMAKILYEFIMVNSHLFSNPIMAAAKVLLEEIQKAEQLNRSATIE